jgi:hypothetical protein
MKQVKSSTICAVDYDGDKLTLKFKSGGIYDYPDVPKELHDRMMAVHDAGESIGKFFHANIRDVYSHKKREESEK